MELMEQTLIDVTRDCGKDMHEPDNVTARIVGYKLDNAMGEVIIESAIKEGWQEYVVILERNSGEYAQINLATLIAYARLAIKAGMTIDE